MSHEQGARKQHVDEPMMRDQDDSGASARLHLVINCKCDGRCALLPNKKMFMSRMPCGEASYARIRP